MAIGTTLPPRAYTREILTAAFNWLQTQPDSVRTKATTPDALVGLYTRAQRFGSVAESEAPVSSQNFMSDLKNLAEGLKAFDGAKVQLSPAEAAIAGPLAPSAATTMPASAPLNSAAPSANNHHSPARAAAAAVAAATAAAPLVTPTAAAPDTHVAPAPTQTQAPSASTPTQAAPSPSVASVHTALTGGLNAKALAMLQEVQTSLNLSTETEAANMMIALAYKTLKASTLLS